MVLLYICTNRILYIWYNFHWVRSWKRIKKSVVVYLGFCMSTANILLKSIVFFIQPPAHKHMHIHTQMQLWEWPLTAHCCKHWLTCFVRFVEEILFIFCLLCSLHVSCLTIFSWFVPNCMFVNYMSVVCHLLEKQLYSFCIVSSLSDKFFSWHLYWSKFSITDFGQDFKPPYKLPS